LIKIKTKPESSFSFNTKLSILDSILRVNCSKNLIHFYLIFYRLNQHFENKRFYYLYFNMKFDCGYAMSGGSYVCRVINQHIFEDEELKLIGIHHKRKTDNDVRVIYFTSCKLTKIPQGLTKQFPNLEKYRIIGCDLENISKCDLIEYKNFKEINFSYNKIEYLPGDLFEGFDNLEIINLRENNLKIVEPNILNGLKSLKEVNFGKFLEQKQDDDQLLITNSILFDKFMQHDVENVRNFITKLLIKSQETQKLNTNLTHENKKISKKCQELEKNIQKFCFDIKNFTEDETTKDFRIQIDDREFPVHKFLLAARSPTLAEILKNNPEVENLNLVDISVEIFEIILKFLYSDELPGDNETNFLHLFAAAGKLKIEELKNFSAIKIIELINAENALEILNVSNKYEHEELRQKAFEEIKKKYPKIEFEDAWIHDGDKIEKILDYFMKIKKLEEGFRTAMKMEYI